MAPALSIAASTAPRFVFSCGIKPAGGASYFCEAFQREQNNQAGLKLFLMKIAVNGGVGEQESFALASVLLYEDAGALESNGQSSDDLKRRARYHITPTTGKILIEAGKAR